MYGDPIRLFLRHHMQLHMQVQHISSSLLDLSTESILETFFLSVTRFVTATK